MLVQFSPAAGRAGAADRRHCGEHSPCSGHTGFAPHRGVCAFPVYSAQAPGCSIWSGPCAECGSSFQVLHKCADSVAPACCLPWPQRFRQPKACARSPGRGASFPSAGQDISKVLKGKNLQPRILYPARLSFRKER